MWSHEKLKPCDKSTFYGNESELLTQKPEIIFGVYFPQDYEVGVS